MGRMQIDNFKTMSPEGKLMMHVGLPPPLTAFSASKKVQRRSRPSSTNTVKFVPSKSKMHDLPPRASDDYIRRLNIGLSFSHDVVSESAPGALAFEEVQPKQIFSKPKNIFSHRRTPASKGPQGRHNAIGDPTAHRPCTLSVPRDIADIRKLKAYPVKPFLKKVVQEEQSVAGQTSVAASTTHWDEFVLNKLSNDTADFIVNKHSHGQQRERLQNKVLSDSKEEISSEIFKETQHFSVESIFLDRKAGIDHRTTKGSVSSFVLSENDKESVKAGTQKEEQTQDEVQEEYIPKYLGKPLERNYMSRFLTKAQQKREDGEQEDPRFINSKYNQHKLLNNLEPFTEDMLNGRYSLHCPGNTSRIIFDQQTQYRKNMIPCFPEAPGKWGPKQALRRVPVRGHRPWMEYPKLIITTYQRQVLSETDGSSPNMAETESIDESEELTSDLLLAALSTWRTTWYMENKWRDGSLENINTDMKDISEHVRITAAIACGAALGYRSDWDLDEPQLISEHSSEGGGSEEEDPISGYRAYSPSELRSSSQRSASHNVVDNLVRLLVDKSERVQVAAAVTLLAIGASVEKAKSILLKSLGRPDTMQADVWAAVQCLAMENVNERIVIDKLIIMTQSHDPLVRVTSTKLLVRLSHQSNVVLFMVADILNNKMWANRYMACKVIQKIKTPLNKDILHKLLTIMWTDYSESVRSVAAETIGVKGHGNVLHDELCCRLKSGGETERVDALHRVVQLGMMTGRMKTVFLRCFVADHVSVRFNAAKAAGQLKFSDNDVIEGLITLISEDHSAKVKTAAIEALADIGVVTDSIISQLVWSAQYQQESEVRSAACLVLAMLGIRTEEVVNVLRDRLTADAESTVKRASTQALQMLGLKPEKDASLILAIKDAVKKLGSKESILAAIINSENPRQGTTGTLGSLTDLTGSKTRLMKSRERTGESGSRLGTSDSQIRLWPAADRVLEAEREATIKKEKIQALLRATDKQPPKVKFLWRKDSSGSDSSS